MRGIYAAEIDELGAASAFPRLWAMASEHGGIVRGMMARGRAARRARKAGGELPPGPRTSPTDLLSFTGGFSVLVDAYERALEGSVSTNTPVSEIDRGPGGWRAVLETGDALACRELVLAIPAPAAHPLVAMCAPERLDLDGLRDVRHAAVTAVHLGLEGAPLPPGFGFLVPPDEDRRRDPARRGSSERSSSRTSSTAAPSGTSSVTAMFRGSDVSALDHDRLVDRAVAELEKALAGHAAVTSSAPRRTGRPRVVASHVQRWTDVIPRYAPGHRAMTEALDTRLERMLPGLHVAGNHNGGVSVDDRIRTGTDTAARVAERVAHLSAHAGAQLEPVGGAGEAS